MKVSERGTFSIKSIQKGYIICQNEIQKGKGWDHEGKPTRTAKNFLDTLPRIQHADLQDASKDRVLGWI